MCFRCTHYRRTQRATAEKVYPFFPRGERGASFGPDFARTASGKSPLCNLISLPSRHFNRDRYQIRWHFRSLTYFLRLQRRNSSPFNGEPSCNDAPRDARGGDALFVLCVCVCVCLLSHRFRFAFPPPPHFSPEIAPPRAFFPFELDRCENVLQVFHDHACEIRFVIKITFSESIFHCEIATRDNKGKSRVEGPPREFSALYLRVAYPRLAGVLLRVGDIRTREWSSLRTGG